MDRVVSKSRKPGWVVFAAFALLSGAVIDHRAFSQSAQSDNQAGKSNQNEGAARPKGSESAQPPNEGQDKRKVAEPDDSELPNKGQDKPKVPDDSESPNEDQDKPKVAEPDDSESAQTSDADLIEQPSGVSAPPPAPTSSLLSQLGSGSLLSKVESITPERAAEREAEIGGSAAANVVSGAQVTVLGTTDTGDLLTSSVFNTGVFSRQVSPVITNTRVRGYRYSQIRTTMDGTAWFPVRPDADTPLSRFDSNIVEDVAIIRGPYNVRLGPGFSFIDVSLRKTPRYDGGVQLFGVSKATWDTNGQQWYGRQSFKGGDGNYGFHVGYGHRGGSDYDAGDGLPLSTGYESRDWNFEWGYDVDDNSTIEFTYLRTEMTDVDTPGQVNDFRFLLSNGFSLRYVDEDHDWCDRFSLTGWYNDSRFAGTLDNKTVNPADPDFFFPPASPTFPDRFARVTTSGNSLSTGFRSMMSWGEADRGILTLGTDLTVMRQEYLEKREANGVIDFGVPSSQQTDPGIFVDARRDVTDELTVKAGGRVDFFGSNSKPVANVEARSLALNFGVPLKRNYLLGAGHLSADYQVNDGLTFSGGVGYGERAPNPTDLYGDLPHLSIMQEGAFFVPHGEVLLKKERALQADLGLTIDCDDFQGGASVFYSEVGDFITYDAPHLPPPSGPHEQHAIGVNRDARFAGGEVYGDLQLTEPLSVFGALSYVNGKDVDLDEPMWGVAPLDTRLGVRLVDSACQRWGIEYIARIVAAQNRLSSVGFIGELPTPSFNTHDIRGYFKINESATLVAGVENIGDVFYQEHLDTRLDLQLGANAGRGIVRRGRSVYIAFQAEY